MTALGRAGAALRDRVLAALPRDARGLPTLRPRRRRVTVVTGPWVPGWALRLVCVALALASIRLAGAGATLTVIGALLATLVLVRPGGSGPVLVLVFTGLVLVVSTDGGWRPASFVVLLTTHLLVQIGALLGRSSWAVRVELAALGVPAPRFLAVQVAAQVAAVLGAAVTADRFELPWLAVLAVVGLAGLVLWLVSRAPRLSGGPTAR